MAIPMLNITPLQVHPNALMVDYNPLLRSVEGYRRGADDAAKQREIAHAGTLSPEEGYAHLMRVGLPEQARQMGLYPLQRRGLEAEQALARARAGHFEAQAGNERAMAPWQRQLMEAQARLAQAQAEQARAAGERAREELELRRRVLGVDGAGAGSPMGGGLGIGGLGLWNPLMDSIGGAR